MKAKLSVAAVLGGLLLVGAGCQQTPPAIPPTQDTETPVANTDTTNQPATTAFTLTADSDANTVVKTSWTAPTNLSNDATIRILHSASPNVEFPGRAFWTSLAKNKTRFEWDGVPSGKRFFRLCVFEKGACTQYSNEVEVIVK